MKLILLLNGSVKKIFQVHNFDESDFEILKIDEKDFAKPLKIIKYLKMKKYSEVYYACIENNLQRFHFFMFLYSLISLRCKSAIIDELGNKKNFSFFKFFFLHIPQFFLETLLSLFVVVYYKIKIPIIRWKLKIH